MRLVVIPTLQNGEECQSRVALLVVLLVSIFDITLQLWVSLVVGGVVRLHILPPTFGINPETWDCLVVILTSKRL